MHTNIGISEKNLDAVRDILNRVLSDEYVLYTKTRNFHWNVTGPHFHDYHKFFEAQFEEINGIIDEVAERTRQLGGRTSGSLAEFMKTARLKEVPGRREPLEAKKMIRLLLEDQEALIVSLRRDQESVDAKYKDAGTCDFLTGVMEQHEKMAWMLRSHLE